MRGRRAYVAGIAFGVLLGLAAPARAATVGIVDFAFSQSSVTVGQGQTVSWHNAGSFSHTSTQDASLSLWKTGTITPGTTSAPVTLRAAGTYPYHCSIHPSMTARVRVPILVSPSTGTGTTTFTITLASALQSGFVYDVQRKIGSGSWSVWRSGVTTRTLTFNGTTGTVRFRSRLRKLSNGATSLYSPAKAITIS
jgi:plastocyanin